MNSFANRIFSIWSIAVFAIFVPLLVIYYLLVYPFPEKTRLLLVFRAHKVWGKIWRFCSGIRVKIEGKENLRQDQACVLIANHSNMLDIILIGSSFLHPFKTLVKREMTRLPMLGWLFAMMGIPVDRSSKESRKKSLDRMIAELKAGISIFIFPEGTRNRTEQMMTPFYEGAFRIAIAAQVPIQPIVILDTRELQPVGTTHVYPGKAQMFLLEQIPTLGMAESDVSSFKQQVFDLMLKVIQAHTDSS